MLHERLIDYFPYQLQDAGNLLGPSKSLLTLTTCKVRQPAGASGKIAADISPCQLHGPGA